MTTPVPTPEMIEAARREAENEQRRQASDQSGALEAADVGLDVFGLALDGASALARAAGSAAQAGLQVAGSATESAVGIAGTVAEGAAQVAGAVAEGAVNVIGGVLGGLGDL
jgi:hypothetical protein